MSHQVASYLVSALSDRARVTSDLITTALFYVEASQRKSPPAGSDDELAALLAQEKFTPGLLDDVKRGIVGVAVDPQCTEHFISAVRVLQAFGDPKLVPLLVGWLDEHLRKLLLHSAAVSQLLFALTESGAPVPHRGSSGVGTVELNIQTAREYLKSVLGVQYPW